MIPIRAFHYGKEFYRCLEGEIERAEKEILINVYSFHDDSIGERLLTVLKEKAGQGVPVKIILDGLGSRHDGREVVRKLEGTGVDIKIFRPRSYYLYRHPVFFLRRDHARIFLIDRNMLGLGGMCVGEIYDDRQDLSVFLEISHARTVVAYFEYLWALAENNNAAVRRPDPSPYVLSPSAPEIAALISTPIRQEQMIYRWYVDHVKNAEKRIIIVSTWFLPTAELLKELMAARERGVEVAVVTPFHTDKRWYDYFRGAAIPRLLHKDVAWHGTREYFHQKFSVIDGHWCLGSANFDMISMNRNYELNVCGQGGAMLEKLEHNFETLMASGERTAKTRLVWIMRWVGNIIYPLLEVFIRTD